MHCRLLVRDFLSLEEEGRRFPAAETLVARGRRRLSPEKSPETWLFSSFALGTDRDLPVAPYTLLADGGAPERHFWMRADPTHLLFLRDSLVLSDETDLEVTREEAESLVETLNDHFSPEMLLYPVQPARWYARFDRTFEVRTTPTSLASGAGIGESLPGGPEGNHFRKLMNEAQMLLHNHPVNVEREARGVPPLNSIWFWGGGVLEQAQAAPALKVFGDDALVRGLALPANAPLFPLPAGAHDMLSVTDNQGLALVVVDRSAMPALALQAYRDWIEQDWLSPLLGALRSGRIGMLSLVLPTTSSLFEVETVRSDLRHFWRIRKPLEQFAG